jgi:RNA polymerase sigma-70 factor (ECF subfamily)
MKFGMSDLDHLLQDCPSDDPRIPELLVREYYAGVFRLARSILDDPDEADDAAQETLLKALAHLRRYQAGTHVKRWLATIAVNVCRDRLRRNKVRYRLKQVLAAFSLAAPPAFSPEEAVIHGESSQQLRHAVAALDEKHRLPILLRYVHGLPVRDIALILGIREGTVHSRLHYAHKKLRTGLAADANTPDYDQTEAPWKP